MGKTIIIFIFLVLLSTMSLAQNYKYLYNPYSTKLDRTWRLNQTGFDLTISNPLTATEKILSELNKYPLDDRIVLLRLSGNLSSGKVSDIRFNEINSFLKERGVYVFIRNISKLKVQESEIQIDSGDIDKVEDLIIKEYSNKNNSKFGSKIPIILQALTAEKQEDERNQIFEERLISEVKNILEF